MARAQNLEAQGHHAEARKVPPATLITGTLAEEEPAAVPSTCCSAHGQDGDGGKVDFLVPAVTQGSRSLGV